jgi:serine/threonine protein kinase
LSAHPEKKKSIRESIRKEWKIVCGLDHVHLVKSFAVEFQQSKCFVLMEYCPNRSLWNNVEDNPLYPDLVRKYTAQVWKGDGLSTTTT